MQIFNKLKEKNNFMILCVVTLVLFLLMFLSKGFSLMFFVTVFLWFLFFKKFSEQSFKINFQLFVGLVVITSVALIFSGGASKKVNNTTNSFKQYIGKEYIMQSEDVDVEGKFRVIDTNNDSLTIEYAVMIKDPDFVNNGKCIDNGGDWCSNDPDGSHNEIERIKYHYLAHFPFESKTGYFWGPTLIPVYCNHQLFESSPFETSGNEYWCNFNYVANWKPTEEFLLKGQQGFDSIETFLSVDSIDFYDFSDYYQMTYETTDKSGKISQGPILSNSEITEKAPLVKKYSIKIVEK